jgi:hypothetical protein
LTRSKIPRSGSNIRTGQQDIIIPWHVKRVKKSDVSKPLKSGGGKEGGRGMGQGKRTERPDANCPLSGNNERRRVRGEEIRPKSRTIRAKGKRDNVISISYTNCYNWWAQANGTQT